MLRRILMWWEDELLWNKSEKVWILLAIVFVIGVLAYIALCECGTVV